MLDIWTKLESDVLNFRVDIRYFCHGEGVDDMIQDAPAEHNDSTSYMNHFYSGYLLFYL